MRTKAIKANATAQLNERLNEALDDGFKPTLAIVFISAINELKPVQALLQERGIQVFGSSSGSEFIDEEITKDAMAVLLLEVPSSYFHIALAEADESSIRQTAEAIGKAGLAKFRKPSFLLISGNANIEGDLVVDGLKDMVGENMIVYGGKAADDYKMRHTFVFTEEKVSSNGLLALILDNEKVTLDGLAIGGWKPIGMARTITRSEGNTVYTIDNEPALDFVLRYSGIRKEEVESYMLFIYSNFQFQLLRENKHPVMRAPLNANMEDRSITFGGGMPQGAKVRLCLLPGYEVVETVIKEFEALKEKQPDVDAAIMFSCAGRQLSLGPFVHKEIESVKELWPVPMAGFFCFGEIGKVPDGNYQFHNMTCSLALLKEV